MIFILAETLIFKSILVPYYLKHLARKNKVTYETEPDTANFNAILKVSIIIVLSFLMANKLHFHAIDIIIFTENNIPKQYHGIKNKLFYFIQLLKEYPYAKKINLLKKQSKFVNKI